ncbi:hypothetical protein LC082_09545 [Microbacterium esteraromaticum]|uniref:hypothetical protein n=1 Tax=Microbacterium esteraromaticum TaxID=57043 RepID=UPI001CD2ADBB|nr:hypothetical protein [Microbacterium esteraromaticum]MCA1307142.1 hypothetical protein [Microbacterium esteraromaticum]
MSELTSVWHYTTADGLHSIVTKSVLWASSHRFMNDSEEPKYATNVLRAAAAEVRLGLSSEQAERFDKLMRFAERSNLEAFLLCGAHQPDLLTVWRGYGSAVPYAIELDAQIELLPVAQSDIGEHPSPPQGWGRHVVDEDEDGRPIYGEDPDAVRVEVQAWAPVQYDPSTARSRVERIAKLAARRPDPLADALLPWTNLAGIDLLQLKHPAFEDEREARMVFEVHPRWKFVKHRTTRFGLTPYIEVSAPERGNQHAINDRFLTKPASRLPIRAVHIGPSPLGDESVDSLAEFLEFHGYPNVPIEKSSTPFR